jgi:hypothetical protein
MGRGEVDLRAVIPCWGEGRYIPLPGCSKARHGAYKRKETPSRKYLMTRNIMGALRNPKWEKFAQ